MKAVYQYSIKLLFIFWILNVTFFSCKNSPGSSHNSVPYIIDIENCKTLINLRLSDLIDSCTLVPLETTNESILGDGLRYVYVSDEFILIDDNRGVCLFSVDGRFIGKIINQGRGPGELSIGHTAYISDDEDILFINNLFNNTGDIMCYNLKSRSLMPPVTKCFPGQWGDLMLYNDSVIAGTLSGIDSDSNPFAMFYQDFRGNFLSGIHSRRTSIRTNNQEEVLQRMQFYYDGVNKYAKYIYDDTLFILKDLELVPYIIVQNISLRTNTPGMIPPEAGTERNFFEKSGNPYFMIIRNATFEGFIPNSTGSRADYRNIYILLNKANGKYGIINSFTDDLTGKVQGSSSETISFPVSQANNMSFFIYNSRDLLGISPDNKVNRNFPQSLYEQLDVIKDTLRETDNPVLLIGKPTKDFATSFGLQ